MFSSAPNNANQESVSYSDFINMVSSNQVRSVTISDRNITGIKSNSQKFETYIPSHDENLLPVLYQNKVKVEGKPPEQKSILFTILLNWFPFLLLIGIYVYFMKSMQGGGRNPMTFGRSKAKVTSGNKIKVKFSDVAGCDEAKEDVEELVEFLKDPNKFQKLGGKIPCGALLVGPPGTGKTLLAKAVAGEANVPFFSISGSDFVEMFVGVGASRVRDMFDKAKSESPCIIFIDEIDAVGRNRGIGHGGGNDEREQTLNQLLVEMDGFEGKEGIIVMAATNRPDVLDPALLRPGRFDRQVTVPLPDVVGREQILGVHIKKVPEAKDVEIKNIARGTPGFSGADLANLVNEAALMAARNNSKTVSMSDLEFAKDKILMGKERKSMIMNDKDKLNTAYHEAGHAIVGLNVPDHDPVYKSIIPRGRALGVTMYLPEEDKYSQSARQLESQISSLMGGRLAEEIIFGKESVTTGASNDIERATDIAKNYVTRWGLSRLGPICYNKDETDPFLGNSRGTAQFLSEDTAKQIDAEVKKLIDKNHLRARKILKENMDKLKAMADALMVYETIDKDQIQEIMDGKPVSAPKDWDKKVPNRKLSLVPKVLQKTPKTSKADETSIQAKPKSEADES